MKRVRVQETAQRSSDRSAGPHQARHFMQCQRTPPQANRNTIFRLILDVFRGLVESISEDDAILDLNIRIARPGPKMQRPRASASIKSGRASTAVEKIYDQ